MSEWSSAPPSAHRCSTPALPPLGQVSSSTARHQHELSSCCRQRLTGRQYDADGDVNARGACPLPLLLQPVQAVQPLIIHHSRPADDDLCMAPAPKCVIDRQRVPMQERDWKPGGQMSRLHRQNRARLSTMPLAWHAMLPSCLRVRANAKFTQSAEHHLARSLALMTLFSVRLAKYGREGGTGSVEERHACPATRSIIHPPTGRGMPTPGSAPDGWDLAARSGIPSPWARGLAAPSRQALTSRPRENEGGWMGFANGQDGREVPETYVVHADLRPVFPKQAARFCWVSTAVALPVPLLSAVEDSTSCLLLHRYLGTLTEAAALPHGGPLATTEPRWPWWARGRALGGTGGLRTHGRCNIGRGA